MNTIGGASGDMLIASLIDSGLGIDDLKSQLNLLDVGGFELSVVKDKRAGMVGTHSVSYTHLTLPTNREV